RGIAVDVDTSTLIVLADQVIDTGVLLLISEETGAISSSIPFPTGARPDELAGAVVNQDDHTVVVSMADVPGVCTNVVNGVVTCTGLSVFDLNTHAFGPLDVTLIPVDNFALDRLNAVTLGTSDLFLANLLAADLNSFGPITCEFHDDNLFNLFADPDGIAADPKTHIWIAGNFDSATATVLNLNGATFSGLGTDDCHLTEAGTEPNSVNHDTGTGASGMPGVAINVNTHKGFMTAAGTNQIALLNLPTNPVTQLADSQVTSVASSIPNDPQGNPFVAAN